MADILVQMIEESASVPAEVTDLILAQFLPKQSVSLASDFAAPGYPT